MFASTDTLTHSVGVLPRISIKCTNNSHKDNPKQELVATVVFDGPHVETPEADSVPSVLTLNDRFDTVLLRYLWWMTDEARHTIRDEMTTEVLNWIKD